MIQLGQVEMFKRCIDALSTFISEGNFRFSKDGVSFKAIDPSQIVLVDFSLPKKVFTKYDVEPTMVGIDLVEFSKVMSRVQQNDKLSIDLNDSEITLKLEGDMEREFKLPLIDVSEEEVSIPVKKFDSEIKINARVLKEALKDASLFGSSVILRVKEGKFFVEARGAQGTLKSIASNPAQVGVEGAAEVVSKYSLNFLSNIVKEASPADRITLKLKSDAPMEVSYPIGEASLTYHLAHMIL